MRARTWLVVIAVLLVAAFVAANGPAFLAPTTLNLIVASVQAPLGLVMLCILVVAALAAALTMALWRGASLAESRRHAKELQAQRLLAEQAEASRFTELRSVFREEMARLAERIDAANEALRGEIRDNANSLAAVLGEMDDRLGRAS